MRYGFSRSAPKSPGPRVTRRDSAPLPSPVAAAAKRTLSDECRAALADKSSNRETRLLSLSNSLFERASVASPDSALARVAAYESVYMALGAVVVPLLVAEEPHPSRRLVASVTRRLNISIEDAFLAQQMAGIYEVPGWEQLDLESVTEWCSRVRLAVFRFMDAR